MVVACGELCPTGLHPDREFFEVMLQVAEVCLLAAVLCDFSIHCPVGQGLSGLCQGVEASVGPMEEIEKPPLHHFCGFL